MFFVQDILFRDGPLAIVWMAGHNEISSKDMKNRRNRHYLRIMESDIVELCDLMRKHLPEMGSATGLSLKKFSTLINGLGVIHSAKLDSLTRDMNEARMTLIFSRVVSTKAIDLPNARQQAIAIRDPVTGVNMDFGDIQGFGEFYLGDFSEGNEEPRALPSIRFADAYPQHVPGSPTGQEVSPPRHDKRKKRKSGADEDVDVLKMLEKAIAANPMANCIIEHEPIARTNPEDPFPFDDFGGDSFGAVDPLNIFGQGSANGVVPNRLGSPVGRTSTTANLDDGVGRHGRGIRGRRASEDEVVPENVEPPTISGSEDGIQLGSLDSNVARPVSRGRRKKRKLDIDEETQLSMEEVYAQLRHRPTYDELEVENALQRARIPKEILISGADLINGMAGGRKILGRGLSSFMRNHLIDMRQKPSRPEIQRAERIRDDQSRMNIDARANATGINPAGPPTLGDDFGFDGLAFIPEESDVQNEEQNREIEPPSDDFGRVDERPEIFNPDVERQDEFEDQSTTFKTLFPPQSVDRKRAAVGFFQLLRQQANQKVELEQTEWFGEITITKL